MDVDLRVFECGQVIPIVRSPEGLAQAYTSSWINRFFFISTLQSLYNNTHTMQENDIAVA